MRSETSYRACRDHKWACGSRPRRRSLSPRSLARGQPPLATPTATGPLSGRFHLSINPPNFFRGTSAQSGMDRMSRFYGPGRLKRCRVWRSKQLVRLESGRAPEIQQESPIRQSATKWIMYVRNLWRSRISGSCLGMDRGISNLGWG